MLLEGEEEGEKEGEKERVGEKEKLWVPLVGSYPGGLKPSLTGNRTYTLLVNEMMLWPTQPHQSGQEKYVVNALDEKLWVNELSTQDCL